jgi:hypothetical protein
MAGNCVFSTFALSHMRTFVSLLFYLALQQHISRKPVEKYTIFSNEILRHEMMERGF